jgi:hypothetical protein
MTISALGWRGKFLNSGKDNNNKKYISMNGNKSEIYIPIQIEENTSYKIQMELRKESGNGIIHCDIFGNKNFTFEDISVKCESSFWEKFDFIVTTKTFPKTLSFYLRFLRKDGVGAINIADISIEKINISDTIDNESNEEAIVVKEKTFDERRKEEEKDFSGVNFLKENTTIKKTINILGEKMEEFTIIKTRENSRGKVLIYHATNDDINQLGLIDAFYDNGFDVCAFSFRQFFTKYKFEKTQNKLIEIAKSYNPNWIHAQFQFYDNIVGLDTIRTIKKELPNVYITNWSADVRNIAMPYFVEVGKVVDKSLIVSEGQLDLYRNAGCDNVDYWQNAVDPKYFYRKSDEERKKGHSGFGKDIVFCANRVLWYGFPGTNVRELVASSIENNFKKTFALYGNSNWTSLCKNSYCGSLKFYKQNDVYNSTKIVISVNHYNDIYKYFSDRQLISMATGTLVLCHYIPGLEEYFENKKDLVWFNSADECVELCKYYLNNPEEANEIGKNAALKILKEHTYFERVKELAKRLGF